MKKTMWFPLACTVLYMVAIAVWSGDVSLLLSMLVAPVCVTVYILFGDRLGKVGAVLFSAAIGWSAVLEAQSFVRSMEQLIFEENHTLFGFSWLAMVEMLGLIGAVCAFVGTLGRFRYAIVLQCGALLQAIAGMARLLLEYCFPHEVVYTYTQPTIVWVGADGYTFIADLLTILYYIGLAVFAYHAYCARKEQGLWSESHEHFIAPKTACVLLMSASVYIAVLIGTTLPFSTEGAVGSMVSGLISPLCVLVYALWGERLGRWTSMLIPVVTGILLLTAGLLGVSSGTSNGFSWVYMLLLIGPLLMFIGSLSNFRRAVLLQYGAIAQAGLVVLLPLVLLLLEGDAMYWQAESVWDMFVKVKTIYTSVALAVFYIGLAVLAVQKKREQAEVTQEQGESV